MSAAPVQLPRRERNKQEKRAALLASARRLFARKGFAATTTAEIAGRAGVGAGTLFLYFASKDDLLVAIFRADMDAVVDRAFVTLPRRALLLAELLHVYGAMIALHERDPELTAEERARHDGRHEEQLRDHDEGDRPALPGDHRGRRQGEDRRDLRTVPAVLRERECEHRGGQRG